MALALLTAQLLSTIALSATFAFGYFASAKVAAFYYHMLLGFASSLIAVFSHSMTMFYFVGTGRMIREVCLERNLGSEYILRAKKFRALVFPSLTLAIFMVMATTVVGGAVHTRLLPLFVHTLLSYATLGWSFVALLVAAKSIIANSVLIDELDQAVRR